MKTVVWRVDAANINQNIIKKAARIIRQGGLIAFPTETVYGLGANGLDAAAVQKIFQAKGRPLDNPLILHISEIRDVFYLARAVSLQAQVLMEKFWPGPLTLVLPKGAFIPDEITAGLDTVALRMPRHPVALALIKEAGKPVAAPSANRSGYPSPTQASHVLDDLAGRINAVLDGGPTGVGLESTVLDLSGDRPVILRPGSVTEEDIAGVIGRVEVDAGIKGFAAVPKAPGMKYTHYSPRAEVILIQGEPPEVARKISGMAEGYFSSDKKVGLLLTSETWSFLGDIKAAYVKSMGSRAQLAGIARSLYDELRRCDDAGVDVILTETYKEEGLGTALMNRLLKSAGYKIEKT